MNKHETQLEHLERRLHDLVGSAECPSSQMLGEAAMNLLAPEDATAVHAHLAACPACRAEVSQLQAFWEDADAPDPWTEIKEVVLDWLSPLIPQPAPAMASFRGVMPRAQTFNAAHLWLAVTVQEGDQGRKNLLALVTREDGYPLEHGTAWLCQDDRLFTGGRVDAYGNLVIADLQPGTYDLGIQCDGTRVWVRGVSV